MKSSPGMRVDFYECDFGSIRAPGLLECLEKHILTKRWRYARHVLVEMGKKAPREVIHAKKCPACKIEAALNEFAQVIWLTGGLLTGVEIDPPSTFESKK